MHGYSFWAASWAPFASDQSLLPGHGLCPHKRDRSTQPPSTRCPASGGNVGGVLRCHRLMQIVHNLKVESCTACAARVSRIAVWESSKVLACSRQRREAAITHCTFGCPFTPGLIEMAQRL
jgi:hypothetical protein